LDFARRRDPTIAVDDFLPRSLYGEYLEDLLRKACAESTTDFRIIHGTMFAVTGGGTQPFTLRVDGALRIEADQVALCIGAPPPAAVCPIEPSAQGYPGFAYEPHIEFAAAREILLLGTGLTMADMATAADSQNPGVVVHALSRHGLLPKVQSVSPPIATDADHWEATATTELRNHAANLARYLLQNAAY